MSNVIQNLQQLAISLPDNLAITSSDITLSWSELYGAIGELISKLYFSQSLGLYLNNSPAWIITDLAAIEANLRITPLPTFFSDEQLQHAIADSCVDSIITDTPEKIKSLTNVRDQYTFEIAGQTINLFKLKTSTADPAGQTLVTEKVTYTSGTTGTPKGVVLSQKHIETVARSLRNASQAVRTDRALVMLPLSTLLENIGSIYVPILVGAQIIVPSPAETGLTGSSEIDINALATMLNKYRPTTMILPPQLLKLVVGLATQGKLPDSFRYIAVGGAPVSVSLLEQANALNLPIYQGYGLSEACSVVSVNTCDAQRVGSVGKPLPHAQVRISERGEVLVKGTIYEGYVNQTERPMSELATGDLGYLDDDGYLYITGRSRNTLITGYGRNVSPEWLEAELQAHPNISQAAIFGNGETFLSAVLTPSTVLSASSKKDPSALIAALDATIVQINQQLPDYAQVVEFIVADQPFSSSNLELTSNGRPRRDLIAQHYAAQLSEIYEENNEHIL